MKVALYGGSFNPPHLGHAQVVLHLLHAGFDEVWVIPAFVHPFGKELAPFDHRMRMLELAMADFGARVRICGVEKNLPAPSWTVDTVEHLCSRHPECMFSLVLGEDQKPALDAWRRIEDLRRMVPFFFVRRGPWRDGEPVPSIPDYSSSEIRRQLAAGRMPEGWMHARVCAYIRREGLYGFGASPEPVFRYAIVGLGKVGGSLLFSLNSAHFPPSWCADPDPERQESARRLGISAGSDWRELWQRIPVACLIFCTPDTWRPRAKFGDWAGSPPLCLHAGGMHAPAGVFGEMELPAEKGGILHPVLAVPTPETDLRGRLFSVTGNVEDPVFAHLLQVLSAQILPVPAEKRPLFHALCALLSNGAQVLEIEASKALRELPSPESRVPLWVRQLVEGGLSAFLERGDAGLTGPWARGDADTVKQHMEELAQHFPRLLPVYRALQELVVSVYGVQDAIRGSLPPSGGRGDENHEFS